MPPTLIRDLNTRQVHFADLALEKKTGVDVNISQLPASVLNTQPAPAEAIAGSEYDLSFNIAVALESDKYSVAVVGISVKTVGVDDLAEYAEMLRSEQFQHVSI